MTVFDNTIHVEGLGSSFKILRRTNVLKNPERALKNTSNIATTAATKNPQAALSALTEVIIFLSYG